MRVMVLAADYPPQNWSGIGVAVEHQAQALASIGVEVHILFPAKPENRLPAKTVYAPVLHNLSPDFCPVDPRGFDLVHLHSLALAEFALQVRRRFGIPLVYTVHSLLHLELEDLPERSRWQAVQADLLKQSDWVVFLSESERSAAIRWIPELENRCSVNPHGISPPADVRTPPPLDGLIVFAGRFTKSKGMQLLASLIPEILEKSDSRFALAGGHGDQPGTRLALSLQARYPERCKLMGWMRRDDLDELFARASLVLIPSLYEPFGLVALEAMRVGAPVIASAVGGLIEIIRKDSGGCLIGTGQVQDWSQAVLEIASNSGAKEKMRRRGPRYVAEHFNRRLLAMRLRDEVYAPKLS
jgi:1,4-alpha-glucan branching enzyme